METPYYVFVLAVVGNSIFPSLSCLDENAALTSSLEKKRKEDARHEMPLSRITATTPFSPGPCSVAANEASLIHPPPHPVSPPQGLWGLSG